MPTITELLNGLHPPVRHELTIDGDRTTLRLIDEVLKVEVNRNLAMYELKDSNLFRIIVLYAVNELRGKGSHATLTVLPNWE